MRQVIFAGVFNWELKGKRDTTMKKFPWGKYKDVKSVSTDDDVWQNLPAD